MDYMRALECGQIVRALAGRDKDKVFVVVGIIDDNSVYIADGAKRRIEAPKRKKIKHLQRYNKISATINKKLVNGEVIDNSEIRTELSLYK